ncbi:hypothetical protein KM043_012730 [Ampulex compressa]|nr:hypothetical protein KM043_012730 [Ampulex compressa]
MDESTEELITLGTYVIVKKQNYSKVYKVTANGKLMLGKDQVEMQEIIGKRFWSTFEMIPSKKGKRTFTLKVASTTECWNDLLSELPSGSDNRSITDDGTSQKLSKEEIEHLQESGKTGKEIVGSLIENSKSFLEKTEYSQEKYIKKKERKYFKFLTVCKPSIISLHEVYFRLDHTKIGTLRMDALAQLLSYSDVQSDGLYILYDSGSQGLPAAAMLNRIGARTEGHLINLHPGNMPQSTIVQAMNFPKEQMDRLVTVNIYSFLRLHYQGEESILNNICADSSKALVEHNDKSDNSESENKHNAEMDDNVIVDNTDSLPKSEDKEPNEIKDVDDISEGACALKRKLSEPIEYIPLKKPKWLLDTQRAVQLLNDSKARGLAIVAKEHPLNIVNALLPFLGPSRPFVIFHALREPLQEAYVTLKQRQNVINLRLFSNFLRSYQVLPDRTHPNILTNDTGGYLLAGYLVENVA